MAVQEITEETVAQAVQDNTLAFFDIYATWCGQCRAFGPIFDKASEANPDIFFGKIDIDKNQNIANQANEHAVPTLMIVKEGQIIYQEAGALRAPDLDDIIDQAKKLDVAFGPIFDKASEANPDIFFGKIDIDKNQNIANQANEHAVPTLMIVKEGQIIYQEAGALRAPDLDDIIDQAKKLDVAAALAEAEKNGADPDVVLEEEEIQA